MTWPARECPANKNFIQAISGAALNSLSSMWLIVRFSPFPAHLPR